MNQQRIPKPDLVELECPRCKRTAWAERGAQSLCQPCVNEFLARNVGLMVERVEEDEVIPLPPAGGFAPGGEQ